MKVASDKDEAKALFTQETRTKTDQYQFVHDYSYKSYITNLQDE